MIKKIIALSFMLVFAIAHGSDSNSIVSKGELPNGMDVYWQCAPGVQGPVKIAIAAGQEILLAFTINCGTSI